MTGFLTFDHKEEPYYAADIKSRPVADELSVRAHLLLVCAASCEEESSQSHIHYCREFLSVNQYLDAPMTSTSSVTRSISESEVIA